MRSLGCVIAAVALTAACSSADPGAADSPAAPPGDAGEVATAPPAGAVAHLDPAGFAEAAARPGTVLLDVRTPAEFADGHLAGATNVDMQAADFAARLATLDRSARYALYCRSGHRSGIAADQMRAAGFGDVVDLAGGITAWTAAGRPVTTN
jgi:rhodanese-related sulfurtransferase